MATVQLASTGRQ